MYITVTHIVRKSVFFSFKRNSKRIAIYVFYSCQESTCSFNNGDSLAYCESFIVSLLINQKQRLFLNQWKPFLIVLWKNNNNKQLELLCVAISRVFFCLLTNILSRITQNKKILMESSHKQCISHRKQQKEFT